MKITSASVVAVTVLLYGAMLYFLVATSSLRNDYQPGIEVLQTWSSPGFFLGIVDLCSILFGSVLSAKVAVRCSISAVVICTLMFGFVFLHPGSSSSWVGAQDRNLESTIHTALLNPNFSNRSKVTLIGSAGIALFWLSVSAFALRRRELTIHSSRPPSAAA